MPTNYKEYMKHPKLIARAKVIYDDWHAFMTSKGYTEEEIKQKIRTLSDIKYCIILNLIREHL